MYIIKRDGRRQVFNPERIRLAVQKACEEIGITKIDVPYTIALDTTKRLLKEDKDRKEIHIEEIQDTVVETLKDNGLKEAANAYQKYRQERDLARKNTIDDEVLELIGGTSEYWNTENSNKNATLVTTQRDYLAGIVSKDIARKKIFPKDVIEAHDKGIIYIHDMDYSAQHTLTNCGLINLEDMLQNGTVMNGVLIEKPHRLLTATTIATQVILGVSSSQLGGCSISLSHLAPFVRDSKKYYLNKYKERGLSNAQIVQFANEDLKKEVQDSVQTFNYQVNSMTNTNGQSPFLTVFMYIDENPEYAEETAMLIEEFLKQRIEGMKNENGVPFTYAFPKLIYCLDENNIHEDSKYYYLTKLSAFCSSKRFVPDYISAKKMKEYKDGNVFTCMGCRSFLSPWYDRNGKAKFYGRFNAGVITINLVDVALSANKNLDKFWNILDKRLELCHKAHQIRIKRLENTTSDVAPILWQHGAYARLNKGESLYNIVHGGYMSISQGYMGLYETVFSLIGESHTSEKGKELAVKILKHLNEVIEKWSNEDDVAYGLYGTPMESGTYKFAKNLRNRFGVIEGITDKDYITNSYHVSVTEPIDPFAKLSIEGEYQKYSLGGCISYIECGDLSKNIPAVMEVLKHIYNNTMYAELNIKSDYCMECGYNGEIKLDDKLEWYCPNCGNRDHAKMNVSRRTCGYIGTNFWNKGRTQEINERYVHLDDVDL